MPLDPGLNETLLDAETGMVSELSVVRWQRYGKDRLYVAASSGEKLGWHDLLTGELHVEDAARSCEVEAAVNAWLPATARSAWLPPPPSAPPAPAYPPLPAGVPRVAMPRVAPFVSGDLSLQRAGAEARKQAIAARQAAPVRSFVARVLDLHNDERAWRIGADGEEKVATQIAKLMKADPRWHVLHAIPVGERGSDIDHLVLGPAGVFSLNAKHHPQARIWVKGDHVRVNGRAAPYVRNSRHEAARASRLLSAACDRRIQVTGLVVPVGAETLTVKQQPADVVVVARRQLVAWLRALPEVLSAPTVLAVLDAARQPHTWQPSA